MKLFYHLNTALDDIPILLFYFIGILGLIFGLIGGYSFKLLRL